MLLPGPQGLPPAPTPVPSPSPAVRGGIEGVVRDGSGVLHTFTVPAGSGRWWTVFTIDGQTGTVTPVDRLGDAAPGC
jgi:hypothetical protein